MRDDSRGFFWEDVEQGRSHNSFARPIPPIPDTGWTAPTTFPRLVDARVVAIDCETKDTELTTKGPGFRRTGDEGAHIAGLAVGTPDGGRWYFPMRHTIAPEQNLDPEAVLAWARDNLCTPGQEKVGANLMYDVDALWSEGVPVTGPFIDVQFAAALLDENRFTYSLESLAQDYLGEGKVGDELRKWVERAYGDDDNYRQHIHKAPPCLVGPYAESDVDLPLRLLERQRGMLEEQGLTDLFRLETALVPGLVRMRQRGVRVDIEYAKRLDDELTASIEHCDVLLSAAAGRRIDVNSRDDLARLFKAAGVEYPMTQAKKPVPSFTKAWLAACTHPTAALINERRKLEKYRNTFVRGYVLGLSVNDRLHALFHPLKGDENGTVSGRFSSSLPNLQNIPARDPVWGPKLRALFIPEDGEVWGRHDWSQIEYRFLAHYARGPSGNTVRQKYRDDPKTDFHEMVLDMVAPVAGWDVSTPAMRKEHRKPTKNLNFGLCYGMGKKKLIGDLGLTDEEGEELFEGYHTAAPFVQATSKEASRMASERGYIMTVLHRRARFDLYEPINKPTKDTGADLAMPALPYDRAVEKYGSRVRRAYTHKALNRLLQGSSADLMKKAMLDVIESGVESVLGAPLLTCHDELCHSVPPTPAGREALNHVKHLMETSIELRVPVFAEQSVGPNWGDQG